MTDIEIPKIPEVLLGLLGLGLSEFVIIVIGIIILIWAIFWFVIPFYVYGIWRRIKNIEGLIRQQVEGRYPDYSYPKLMKRPSTETEKKYGAKEEIDEETKKILEEMGYHRKGQENKED